jgi:PAS domain S-box-containing protein
MSDPAIDPRSEVERLRDRVEELESTMQAIRSGEVDALVTASPEGERVFTLQTADQPYRILVETMGEGAAMIDTDGLIVYCNIRFAEMAGMTPDRVIGRMLQEFIATDQPNACSDLLSKGAQGEWHCESAMRRAPGEPIPVLLSVNRAEVTGSVFICLVATDITARREYESIVEAERLANSILEQALEAIIVCNAEGRIIRCNSAAAKLCPASTPGAHFDTAVSLIGLDGSAIRAASVVAGQIVQGAEALAAGVPVLVNASPLPGRAGAVVTLTDISQRKEFEESLKRNSEDLARSNADLERFAFLASHDLQEPLRMVNAYVQLLTRRYRDAAGAEAEVFAGYIESGVRRMRQLLDDLLNYSRAAQQPELRRRRLDSSLVLAAGLTSVASTVSGAGAQVTWDALPWVYGDEEQLALVFAQLIDNGVKFANGRQVHIHVSSAETPEGTMFSVKDDGPGIASRYQESVFQLFKRLHGKEVPGSGIGLALCRRIIERHGGRIWMESEEGKGTTVRFVLPVSR